MIKVAQIDLEDVSGFMLTSSIDGNAHLWEDASGVQELCRVLGRRVEGMG